MTANRWAVHDGIQNEGRRYRMGERSNAAYYNGLPGVKPVKCRNADLDGC